MSNSVGTVTSFSRQEVLDAFARYCVSDDWTLEYRDRESIFLKKGPSGSTGCLLLILFLPIGLAYLLTDWGRGKLTARALKNDDGDTELLIEWQNAGIRGDMEGFIRWLKEQEEGDEEDEEISSDRHDQDDVTTMRARRRRKRRSM